MSKPGHENEGYLADSIRKYGFAATIEVTNNLLSFEYLDRKTNEVIIVNPYLTKTGQVMAAKNYLEHIAGEGARIQAGLAYNGDFVGPGNIDCLDFMLDIKKYNPDRLEGVAYDMLNDRYVAEGCLTHSHTRLVEKMLQNYDEDMPLAAFFALQNLEPCSRRVDEDKTDFHTKMSIIKGLCMELYIKSLFSDEITDKIIHHRHKFRYPEEGANNGKKHEADEIIVCREKDFYTALERIAEDDLSETWVKRWDYL